jgi:hypothetical protein
MYRLLRPPLCLHQSVLPAEAAGHRPKQPPTGRQVVAAAGLDLLPPGSGWDRLPEDRVSRSARTGWSLRWSARGLPDHLRETSTRRPGVAEVVVTVGLALAGARTRQALRSGVRSRGRYACRRAAPQSVGAENRGHGFAGSKGAALPDSPARTAPDGWRCQQPTPPTPGSAPRSRSPASGLENFPEPAELVTETAGVKAELRQQIAVLAIIGVHLIR